jgi:hypothetical protein
MLMDFRNARAAFGLVGTISVGVVAGFACGGSSHDSFFSAGSDSGAGDGSGLGDSGTHFGTDAAASDAPAGSFIITPQNPVLDVTVPGPAATKQFQVLYSGSPVPAAWSIDYPILGTVDSSGNFVASGSAGGVTTVTAQAGSNMATTTLTVVLHMSEDPGGVSGATETQLEAGGSADSAFAWLYPYDQTIFPRGLTAPVLQFAGTAPDAVYVEASAPTIVYSGFYGASSPAGGGGQVTMSTSTWNTIAASVGPTDTLKVQITKISGGQVSGPIGESWKVAQGSLTGTVYYNSYDSALAGGDATQAGAVLKMRPGTPASLLLGGLNSNNCVVCHAVSANGSVIVADGPAADPTSYAVGASYTLTSSPDAGAAATMLYSEPDSQFGFGGLYPDGTKLLSCAALAGDWPPNIPGLGDLGSPSGDRPSVLMNTSTGAVIPASGFDGVVTHALMPTFSPDGKYVAFNNYDTGTGHSLAVMPFTNATNTFGALAQLAMDPVNYLAWPAFLPDGKEVVYNTDSNGDYATWNYYGGEANPAGDLQLVDTATQTVTPLDAANGISNGTPYLPYGVSEAHLNFEPTVLPVAVGGYYWVVFTSRRDYGNTINTATGDSDPFETEPAKRKKLWVAAININPTPGTDPSHPAFYINDQELAAGNSRGFWALDPCQQNGNGCGSGDQCCSGFCRQVNADGGSQLTCVAPPSGCAQANEKCMSTADCCGASQGYQCINGFCAMPSPQ